MNRTRIDWCQYTWNPVTGCRHGCLYCYARGIASRFQHAFPNGFEPTFHPKRLDEPAALHKTAHIFAVSMGDIFGDWVPLEWIADVVRAIQNAPQHTYTILSKNPKRFANLLPLLDAQTPRLILGTSVSGPPPGAAYLPADQAQRIDYICGRKRVVPNGVRTVLSIEPMLGPMHPDWLPSSLDWLIIGGRTGGKHFEPPREWVEPLIDWGRKHDVPVYVKRNCGIPDMPHEYPEGVPHDQE